MEAIQPVAITASRYLFIVYTLAVVRTFREIDRVRDDDGKLRLIGTKFARSREDN